MAGTKHGRLANAPRNCHSSPPLLPRALIDRLHVFAFATIEWFCGVAKGPLCQRDFGA
jgi:hypothetical protein